MKKYLIVLLTILLMMLCIPVYTVSAAEMQLYDEGSRLSSEEFAEAYERLTEAAEHTGMNVVVILGNEPRSDATIESAADSAYDQLYGQKTNGICIYIDVSSNARPYDYISTSGLGQFYYTNSSRSNRVDSMLYAVEKYLYPVGSEDVFGAVMAFADQIENYYEIGIPDRYWIYDDVYHEYYHVENGQVITTSTKPYINIGNLVKGGIIGLFIGIFAAVITSAAVRSKYRFIYQTVPSTYLNKKTVQYTEQSDRFIRTRTSKTHVSSSSGSRSSGGSHHSGGGHSHGGHGGGGHHR